MSIPSVTEKWNENSVLIYSSTCMIMHFNLDKEHIYKTSIMPAEFQYIILLQFFAG